MWTGWQPALPRTKTCASYFPQCKSVIVCFPQAQPNELLFKSRIQSLPERANNIFTRRWHLAKIIRLEVEMFVIPELQTFLERVLHVREIVQHTAALIVSAANVSLPLRKDGRDRADYCICRRARCFLVRKVRSIAIDARR